MTTTTSTTHHRRIELQSPLDLSHLHTLISRAAAAKIDLHLPPSAAPAGEDELRAKVETLVTQYIDDTWRLCRPNLSVNGVHLESDAAVEKGGAGGRSGGEGRQEEVLEVYEDYDGGLKERLDALFVRRNALVARVAEMRRVAPAQAAERFRGEYLRHVEEEEEERARAVGGRDGGVDLGALERWEDVAGAWERAVEGLGALNGGLPEQRARLERARGVVGYLEGK
ncbi:uncharacterized protein BDZ99DRAFT_572767 [Mytilinidion resinicola]|uniref:Mis14-domain-containing protein n=1 Tax=Mytilinidion resinicola TaxID=574789 RepID=A0A6A6YGL5_9PEZI|nr:uncharacterized protein BDZ99DRAFT_572767 [Mytilinidion resinicola]KAF2807880.1 hypothetical protein BDZ99DRAFT_572767 [Mytilinidion resinicola]